MHWLRTAPDLAWVMADSEEWANRNDCTLEAQHCGHDFLCIRGRPSEEAQAELRDHAPAVLAIRFHSDLLA